MHREGEKERGETKAIKRKEEIKKLSQSSRVVIISTERHALYVL